MVPISLAVVNVCSTDTVQYTGRKRSSPCPKTGIKLQANATVSRWITAGASLYSVRSAAAVILPCAHVWRKHRPWSWDTRFFQPEKAMTFQKVNDCLYNIRYASFAHRDHWQADVKTCPGRGLVFSSGVTFLSKVSSRCVSNFHNYLFRDVFGTSTVIRKNTTKFYHSLWISKTN